MYLCAAPCAIERCNCFQTFSWQLASPTLHNVPATSKQQRTVEWWHGLYTYQQEPHSELLLRLNLQCHSHLVTLDACCVTAWLTQSLSLSAACSSLNLQCLSRDSSKRLG